MQALPWKWGIEEAPAREWSEGRGALIAVAMFLGGIAGGTYLVALFFNNIWGMLAAWILAAAMGLFDMSHIKKPMRFWRIATKVNSSWISRGFILVLLFLGASGIQLIIHMVSGAAAGAPTTAEVIFRVIAGVLGFGLAIYSGFVMSYVNGIKFWNSALLPVMVVMGGLAGGAAIILAIDSFTSAADFALVLTVARASLIFYAVVLFIYLWVSTYNGQTARNSALLLLKGDMAVLFWTLIVVIGIVVPLAIDFIAGPGSTVLLIISAVLFLAGNLIMRYSLIKAGRYTALPQSD